MTYTDLDLELIPSGTDVSTGPYYSTGYVDLGVSPDVGTGADIVAIITVASNTALTSAQTVVGNSGTITAAELEAMDDAGRIGYQPIIVRINPNHWDSLSTSTTGVSSDVGRYLGLKLSYTTANPGAITVHATFVTNWTSSPALSWHASGSVIA